MNQVASIASPRAQQVMRPEKVTARGLRVENCAHSASLQKFPVLPTHFTGYTTLNSAYLQEISALHSHLTGHAALESHRQQPARTKVARQYAGQAIGRSAKNPSKHLITASNLLVRKMFCGLQQRCKANGTQDKQPLVTICN
ncbi:hypothetical protein MMC28_000925 [Mycoblastus sanguinarius]|nr:hypothetical protein [Mycoblastus sanguinarius]